jgi:hypothetical protein
LGPLKPYVRFYIGEQPASREVRRTDIDDPATLFLQDIELRVEHLAADGVIDPAVCSAGGF